jgi:hypothetical protein
MIIILPKREEIDSDFGIVVGWVCCECFYFRKLNIFVPYGKGEEQKDYETACWVCAHTRCDDISCSGGWMEESNLDLYFEDAVRELKPIPLAELFSNG